VIAHAAVFSRKSGIAIMADMGVFCLIHKIAQLLEARQKACNSSQGGVSAAIPHQKDFEKSCRRASERGRSFYKRLPAIIRTINFINAIRSANA
jgi:hypothetical protein